VPKLKDTKPIVLMLSLFSIVALVCPAFCETTFTPETKFSVPDYDGEISFTVGGLYESAVLENDTWHFVGLALETYEYDLGDTFSGGIVRGKEYLKYCVSDGNFSVSAVNCKLAISNYDLITWFAPFSGWLNYTVECSGTQKFTLHYLDPEGSWYGPDLWTVYIDSVSKPQNDGWQISSSPERTITVSGASKNVSIFYDTTSPPKEDIQGDDPLSSAIGFIVEFALVVVPLVLIAVLLVVFVILSKRKRRQKKNGF
jgi:hypothetical protein